VELIISDGVLDFDLRFSAFALSPASGGGGLGLKNQGVNHG
jgi:hypothetical protein